MLIFVMIAKRTFTDGISGRIKNTLSIIPDVNLLINNDKRTTAVPTIA